PGQQLPEPLSRSGWVNCTTARAAASAMLVGVWGELHRSDRCVWEQGMSATSLVPTAGTASSGARTLWELIASAVERYGDAPALGLRDAEPALRWSFRELGRQIELVAANLAAQGVEPGDRVMLWGSNRPQWVATFAALLRLGAVVVPFDLRSAPDF